MGKPAARLTDPHICPMFDGPKPHVGGPVVGPGAPTVLIGGQPAAVVGDMCTCASAPDSILLGSMVVLICGKPAARMGDSTVHGGFIAMGCPTVLIGDGGGGGGGAGAGAGAAKDLANKKALEDAAKKGDEKAERTNKDDFKAQFTLKDEAEKAMPGVKYEIETSDGQKHTGKTDASGKTENLTGYTTGDCRVTFLNK